MNKLIAFIFLCLTIKYWYITVPVLIIFVILSYMANKYPINNQTQQVKQVDIVRIIIPIFTPDMIKTNNIPISTKTEAKKVYKTILAKYRIVKHHELSIYADQISQEIEDKTYNLQDNVNFKRENVRNIKSDIKESESELKNSDESEAKYIHNNIKDLKQELLESEEKLDRAIKQRDEFKRDKSDLIINHLNILAHGDEWNVNKTDSMYFIYKDSSGAISARHIINFISNTEFVEGFCKKRDDKRTFRKDRILEYASSLEDLELRYTKYQ